MAEEQKLVEQRMAEEQKLVQQRMAEEQRRSREREAEEAARRKAEEQAAIRREEEEIRQRKEDELKRLREAEEREKAKKKAVEDMKKRIQDEAKDRVRQAESENTRIAEDAKRREEALHREAESMTNLFNQQHDSMMRQQEAATKRIQLEKADRERRAQFEKDYELEQVRKHEEYKARQAQIKNTVKKPTIRKKVVQQTIHGDAPFEPENELDIKVLQLYLDRVCAVEENWPKVQFRKGNLENVFLLGQRRLNVVEVEDDVYVRVGNQMHDFLVFVEKQERLESLRMRGLASGQNFILGGQFF